MLQRAGEQSQITEVIELLAHALVQRGDLARARDYYRDLSILEPQNPVHEQNYRQMVARLGEDSMARSFSAQEGGRAFMADELETSAPSLEQPLEPHVSDALEAALTESELLDSYSLHPNAIAKLESVLAEAPRSARLHQRLATVYAHSERYEDAARSCDVLTELYHDNGHDAQAKEYTSLAVRYRQQAAERAKATVQPRKSRPWNPPRPKRPRRLKSPSRTFKLIPLPLRCPRQSSQLRANRTSSPAQNPPSQRKIQPVGKRPQNLPSNSESDAAAASAASDSGRNRRPQTKLNWTFRTNGSLHSRPALRAPSHGPETGDTSDLDVVVEDEPASSPTSELLEEIRFYIGQQMWDEAAAVIRKCTGLAPELGELTRVATADRRSPSFVRSSRDGAS